MSDLLAEKPLAYSLPYEWGHFSVTPAADAAYELQPLSTDIIRGGIDRATLPADATEILLVGPDEYTDPDLSRTPSEKTVSRIWVTTPAVTATRGIQIACGFEKTRRELLAATLKKAAQDNNVSVAQLMSSYESETGLPTQEFHAQHISRQQLHALLPAIHAHLVQGYQARRRWLRWNMEPLDFKRAYAVTTDIHADFCSDHFNHQLKEQLDATD